MTSWWSVSTRSHSSPVYAAAPVLAVCHHLFGGLAFRQVAWPIAAGVWTAEQLIPRLLVNFPAVALAATLPSVAGIGPSQVGMVEFFSPYSKRETLLACSLAVSAGMILLRMGIGLLFARELTREAYAESREVPVEEQAKA